MDPGLWSSISDDILDRVLAKLPVPCILSLRLVCKKWNALTRSRHFWHLCDERPSRQPCLLFHVRIPRNGCLAVYEPLLNRWYAIPLPFLPPYGDVHLVASGGGLLCFRVKKSIGVAYFICNPIAKSCRELPHYQFKYKVTLQAMVVDPKTRSYKVIIVCSSRGNATTTVYDSTTESWKLAGALPGRKFRLFHSHSGKVFSDGILYCRTMYPPGVMAYNVSEDVWTELDLVIGGSVVQPYLVEHDGGFLMVGRLKPPGPVELYVWKPILEQNCWQVVATTPPGFSQATNYKCAGEGDLIYLMSWDASCPALEYDFLEDSWRWLPERNLQVGCSEPLFTFQPSFEASV